MYIYRTIPTHPEFNWFKNNQHKGEMSYHSGEKLAEFNLDGSGWLFYKNGRVALDYYDNKCQNCDQRVVVYSNGEPDERGRMRPITVLAVFDYLGNGVVFDHVGKIRLKYNQTEGVLLDKTLGSFSKWKWHLLNEPAILKHYRQEMHLSEKITEHVIPNEVSQQKTKKPDTLDAPINDDVDMLAIEHHNFMANNISKRKNIKNYTSFQIRMKAVKINEHFSLHILDQATVHLLFRDGRTNLKLNLGMLMDHTEIVDTNTVEVGQVTVSFEQPTKANTIAKLQKMINEKKRFEQAHLERQLRIRPLVPRLSVDKMNDYQSAKRLQPLLPPAPIRAYCQGYGCKKLATSTDYPRSCRIIRKPTSTNFYISNSTFD